MIKIYVSCQDRQTRTNINHIAGAQNKMTTGLQNELDGVLVVSIEQAVAAPYCGLLLADSGARVLKIERPEAILPEVMTRVQMGRAQSSSG